jgi:dihydrofolate reductase
MVTLDGFFAGKDGDISWHNTDEEFGKFANEQTGEFGTLIFGRTTYDLMASYWPIDEGIKDDPIVANLMNKTPKIVFSKTLKDASWENTKVFDRITPEKVTEWKQKEGKPAAIFGSGTIVQQFANLDLINEYRLLINPIILGEGKLLFDKVKKTNLKLIKTREFKNGNILLYYKPASH